MVTARVVLGGYKRVKVVLNGTLDRILDVCDQILMDVHRIRHPVVQAVVSTVVRWVGDGVWLLKAFPRLTAVRLVGEDWSIAYVGGEEGLLEVRHLFFSEAEPMREELGRVALWQLSVQTHRWLSAGTDLVICELGRGRAFRPTAPIAFTIPVWVHQVLQIPEPVDSLLAGKRHATERHRLNKARRSGFDYRLGQSRDDFELFTDRMYVPYVQARHGPLARVVQYRDQWQRWCTDGGVVLVTREGQPVGGVMCHMAGETCFDLVRGVLDADPELFRLGIETVLTWSAINWACEQGAKTHNMGATRPWRSSGSFQTKRRWGARVRRLERTYATWTLLARDLSPSLRRRINEIGFVTEVKTRFYGVLAEERAVHGSEHYGQELLTLWDEGLDGLLVVAPHAAHTVHECSRSL